MGDPIESVAAAAKSISDAIAALANLANKRRETEPRLRDMDEERRLYEIIRLERDIIEFFQNSFPENETKKIIQKYEDEIKSYEEQLKVIQSRLQVSAKV
jgi:uncharacterized protein (DUF4415 family)